MAARILLDPGRPPTDEELRELLGDAGPRWEALERRVAAMGARRSLRWDGPKHGWSVAWTRAGRPFIGLTPSPGSFTALVVLGRSQVEEVPALALGAKVRGIFEAARPFPDGRWLFVPVEAEADIADLVALLATKLPPTVRARLAGAARGSGAAG